MVKVPVYVPERIKERFSSSPYQSFYHRVIGAQRCPKPVAFKHWVRLWRSLLYALWLN